MYFIITACNAENKQKHTRVFKRIECTRKCIIICICLRFFFFIIELASNYYYNCFFFIQFLIILSCLIYRVCIRYVIRAYDFLRYDTHIHQEIYSECWNVSKRFCATENHIGRTIGEHRNSFGFQIENFFFGKVRKSLKTLRAG